MATNDIVQSIRDGQYTPKIEKPVKPRKMCTNCNTHFVEVTQFCPNCGHAFKPLYDTYMMAYKVAERNMHLLQDEAEAEFKADALKWTGLSTHPNKDNIYQHAKNNGSDLEDIVCILEELYDLFVNPLV